MKLQALTRQMRLFARRVINLGNRRLLPGQELITTPKGPGALSWRQISLLYNQRRVISESDPYFEELMAGPGMQNNPEFAQAWLSGGELPEQAPLMPPVEPPGDGEQDPGDGEQEPSAIAQAVVVDQGHGWYDVTVNGKQLNEKSLRKAEAEALAGKYNGEQAELFS